MRRKNSALMTLVAVFAMSSIAWLDPYRDAVSSGNEEFGKQKYNNAKRYYEKAEQYAPAENDKKKLSFNIGGADFMLESYDSALSGFQQAIQSDDRDVQKKAFFNSGNAYLKQKNYREAINAYMNALKIDPDYAKAKKNIEYVLKQMDNKNKQNDKDKKNNKDKNDDKQKNKDKSSKGDKNQEKNQDKKQNSRQDGSQMNREQVRNILRSLQQSPVRRQKGGGDERRKLEKFW
jgi:Ca-activated chloride channel family protein